MSSSVEKSTGYLAIVGPTTDHRLLVVPGLETYFASYPVVIYDSANRLLEKLLRPTTVSLPELIVIDLSRSTDAGLGFLRELKARERLRNIPVLMRRITTESKKGLVVSVRKSEVSRPRFLSSQPLSLAS
ncbi:hypothetical protein ACO2Q8_01530 [Larkinella sp. VNQ87]|uniref:hypothetical protein n=1 Tax=Larkinella sp. VNQ87 TaxID=3400921 RepID=UPI003C0A61D6